MLILELSFLILFKNKALLFFPHNPNLYTAWNTYDKKIYSMIKKNMRQDQEKIAMIVDFKEINVRKKIIKIKKKSLLKNFMNEKKNWKRTIKIKYEKKSWIKSVKFFENY